MVIAGVIVGLTGCLASFSFSKDLGDFLGEIDDG